MGTTVSPLPTPFKQYRYELAELLQPSTYDRAPWPQLLWADLLGETHFFQTIKWNLRSSCLTSNKYKSNDENLYSKSGTLFLFLVFCKLKQNFLGNNFCRWRMKIGWFSIVNPSGNLKLQRGYRLEPRWLQKFASTLQWNFLKLARDFAVISEIGAGAWQRAQNRVSSRIAEIASKEAHKDRWESGQSE